MLNNTRRENIARKLRICVRNGFQPRFWRHLVSRMGIALVEWDTPPYVPQARTVPLHEIIGGEETLSVCLPMLPRIMGDTPYGDLLPLCALVRYFQPKRVFEFGTHMGATTLQMLANCPEDAHIWTLDLPPDARQTDADLPAWDQHVADAQVGRFLRGAACEHRITQLYANSMDFDPTPFRASMDFIYVDAAHEYAFVANDTRKAFEMLAPGGMIVWHDYIHCEDVRRCLDEVAETRLLLHVEETVLALYQDGCNGHAPSEATDMPRLHRHKSSCADGVA